ncbi:class I SAM-dependent methyltransferase [soil metagenome]
MEADKLYSDPEIAQFYDLENGWAEDLDYCASLAGSCASVLDLGCGTGLFAASLTQRDVVGVDPAAAMLDVAAKRPGGDRVQWVRGDARTVRLDRRFDLVVLTGHAFQVFLTDQDRAAVLRTIAAHLAPKGRFIFDSRNPDVRQWRAWTPANSQRHIEHPAIGRVLAWNDASCDPATCIVTYGTFYKRADGRLHSSQSKIAFPSQERILASIHDAGLAVEQWLGDWSGTPFSPASPEIIPIGTS